MSNPIRWLSAVLLLAGCSLLGGCSAGSQATSDTEASDATTSDAQAQVEVRNQQWVDLAIYVVAGGASGVRLGQVGGYRQETFVIPSHLFPSGQQRELRFRIRPLASRRNAFTQSILAWPGDTVTLTIPSLR
jgi:hypothetical protein